eukprot:30753-Pelagococcus_subviridis.AAC.3
MTNSVTPHDHTSAAFPSYAFLDNTSGAMYAGVPTILSLGVALPSRSVFSSFKSLCATPWVWQYSNPLTSCWKKNRASSSPKRPFPQIRSNNSPPAAYSITIARCVGHPVVHELALDVVVDLVPALDVFDREELPGEPRSHQLRGPEVSLTERLRVRHRLVLAVVLGRGDGHDDDGDARASVLSRGRGDREARRARERGLAIAVRKGREPRTVAFAVARDGRRRGGARAKTRASFVGVVRAPLGYDTFRPHKSDGVRSYKRISPIARFQHLIASTFN